MSVRHTIIILLFTTGAAIALAGLYRYARDAFSRRMIFAETTPLATRLSANWGYYLALSIIVVVAFLLRIEGIDLRGMSHVEVYIPGIVLPPLISEPPPRLDFMTFLSWHWHDEPHPQGYYLLMFFWTKLFGAGLAAIRFPSVIFGVGAVALLYVLASLACNRKVGLIGAAMLALNGHHIFWSQSARMYSLVCFLGLASAILLFKLLQQPRRQPYLETAYVVVTFLGLFTQLFFWVFLAAQMLYTLVHSRFGKGGVTRILGLQSLVAVLGSPLWAHAVYRSRSIDLGSPSFGFIQDFINFGFLFLPDHFSSILPRDIPSGVELAVTAAAVTVLLGGLLNRRHTVNFDPPVEPEDTWRKLLPVAIGFTLIIISLAFAAWRRQLAISFTAFVPLIAVFSLPVIYRLWPMVATISGKCAACRVFRNDSALFFLVLGGVPVLLLVLVSLFKTLMIARGFMLFVPYLIVVQASGVELLARKRFLALPLLVALAAVHLFSVDFHRKIPDPTDYRGLADEMQDRMEADDLIFVYPRDWVTTPLFYYFQDKTEQLVAGDFTGAIESHPDARVWIPLFLEYKDASEEMSRALKHYRKVDQVTAHNCWADLYERARD